MTDPLRAASHLTKKIPIVSGWQISCKIVWLIVSLDSFSNLVSACIRTAFQSLISVFSIQNRWMPVAKLEVFVAMLSLAHVRPIHECARSGHLGAATLQLGLFDTL